MPQQRSPVPLPLSWRRGEVEHAVDMLDDVRQVLRRVVLVEGSRPSGALALGAKDAVEHASTHLHDLIRLAGRP